MKDERFLDVKWRINNLYKIIDTKGSAIDFKMNSVQEKFFDEMHYFNVILKARQLGFSTFILIYLLDSCLFNPNHAAGVIAQGLSEAEDLFRNKVKFAYENLPKWLKKALPSRTDSARKLEFGNGSSITVGTSLRGGTFQKLHVSEYGKISARYPEKAREIKTGALNTVHVGQQIFIESTAEGQQGEFFEVVERAKKLKQQGLPLSVVDPKLFFFPWYDDEKYALPDDDTKNVSVTKEMSAYLDSYPVDLTPNQKAWYIKKSESQGEDMKREYPATVKESFEQSMEGAIYQKEMAFIRENNQITRVPYEPSHRVYTFWDLGKGRDYTSIWFFQHIGREYRFINYHESFNEGWGFYAQLLSKYPYVYAEHLLPHDGETATVGKSMSTARKDLEQLGVRPIRIVPKTNSIMIDIKGSCKPILTRCFFDKENCDVGIKHLDNYRREWNDRLGAWKDAPRHDDASHCADAFRTFAVGYKGRQEELLVYDVQQQYADSYYDPFDY